MDSQLCQSTHVRVLSAFIDLACLFTMTTLINDNVTEGDLNNKKGRSIYFNS